MKITVTFKNPDGISDATKEAVREAVAAIEDLSPGYERELLEESREEDANEALSKWVEYGEYVRIEFDTVAGTATVLPVRS